jgi:hypothetical protein
MKLRVPALLLLLCAAIPTFGRVLSYAPYTNQIAMSAYHERTARHFLLLESEPGDDLRRDLVLYDTAERGAEPRVILAKSDSMNLLAAALYEPAADIISAPIALEPVVLAVTFSAGQTRVLVSHDAGVTWKEVVALRGAQIDHFTSDNDFGGPWVQGLSAPIRIGNSTWPFVVSAPGRGIWAIGANAEAKQIHDASYSYLIGQNSSGTKYLVRENLGSSVRLQLIDTVAGTSVIASDFLAAGYAGWIADDGTAYIVATRADGRFLYEWRNGTISPVAGPRGMTLPAYNRVASQPHHNVADFIAVPTADFNGAWMMQRGISQPTSLMRYTRPAGVETFWNDISGPEIEALIAGPSGSSVLIQVHRDRTTVPEIPFVDPALAVWRVGETMPREYDELYLNEQANKGFVHVNPDAMRTGEKFVFNSGSFEELEQGPISPPIGGGGDVIQEWGVVQASLKQHLILPGVARLQGGFGSDWRTDVTMYNPLDDEQDIDIEYVPMYEASSASRKITVTLAPHEIRFVADALQALFLLENGGGSLHFHPAIGMNVVGRTYSRNGAGTYGFGMTAIDAFNAAGPRFPMTFAGAFPGDHFRTNILLTDTSGRGTEASLRAFGVSGSIGGNNSAVTAPAGGTFQMNGIHGSLNLLQRDSGALIIQPTRGTAIATVVAIDNRTNDPTYFPPDLTATTTRTIPVIGHLAGANGSQFRSDLYLFNSAAQTRTVTLEAKRWDSPVVVNRQFTLLPHEGRVIVDALHTLWRMEGIARLRYWTAESGDGVRVTSRTYTIEESGATYGTLIPPLNNFQSATNGEALEIIGATAGAGFRTNVGLVELSGANFNAPPTTVRIRIIDQQRRQLESFTVSLGRASGMQINDIFGARGITPPAAALFIVEVVDGGGLVGAYATLTDNTTNDTTYFGAQLAARED